MANKTLLPPGFRFHPTDVELVSYYLKRKVMGRPFQFVAISDVELYKFSPWDLPAKSCLRSKDLEWFFFSPRDKKYPKGTRANRSTTTGFWKTTGQDRTITLNARTVGMKKTLIFHTGKPPRGERTDWVMYEYRLTDDNLSASVAQDAYVLCKIFKKSGMGPKIGEQYGAPFNEQEWEEYDDVDYEAASHAFPFLPPQSGAIVLQNGATPPQSSVVPPPSGAAGSVATGDVSGAIMPSPVVPEALEMEGIELDELAHLLMDSPYRADNAHLQFLPAQQEANLAENICNYNEDGLFNELENLLNSFPNNNEASSSIQPVLSELGSENYLELNDIFAPGNGQDGYGWLYPQFSYEPSQMDVSGGYMSSVQGQNGPISELDQVVNYNGYPSSSDPHFGSSMFAPFQ